MSNGATVAVMPPSYDSHSQPDHHLSTSISSIASLPSARNQASQIAKTYRQAAQLFLTRRLPEALSTIESVITPQLVENADAEEHEDGSDHAKYAAPIATASRGTRIKVWSFYLTFLNAVVELGPEEGKHAFGSTKWRALVAKARDGSIWDDVVRDGYGGSEGDVDADVVINLATLLLTHSPSQKLNQTRLETYLSSTSHPSFDSLSSQLTSPQLRSQRRISPSPHANGTSTPRDLNTRLKLLELFTLHVLPRNDEWDYAREFIMMSEVLDDERKEAFLQALHGLKEERQHSDLREKELAKQQQEQLEQQRREAEARQKEEQRAEEERRRRDEESQRPPPRQAQTRDPAIKKTTATVPRGPTSPSKAQSKAQNKKAVARTPPPGLYNRAATLLSNLQTLLFNTAQSMRQNPIALLRTLLFLLAFILAFGRRDMRERVQRMLRNAWNKVKRTVGMGVKVSYI